MNNPNISLSLDLLYVGFYKVGTWWNFKNHVSSFYRIYWITEGKCTITVNHDKVYRLQAGDMFLVPKFTVVDYECTDFMEHFYICFTDDKMESCLPINPSLLLNKVEKSPLDGMLFLRLIELFPNQALPSVNPMHYDNISSIWEVRDTNIIDPVSIESQGILFQLFARFLTNESMNSYHKDTSLYPRVSTAIQYINQNISKKIVIGDIAKILRVTPDHFTRSFRKVMGVNPIDFIQLRRIEIAIHLLCTTNLSIKEIAFKVGFENVSQFTRLFVNKKGVSPSLYRKTPRQ